MREKRQIKILVQICHECAVRNVVIFHLDAFAFAPVKVNFKTGDKCPEKFSSVKVNFKTGDKCPEKFASVKVNFETGDKCLEKRKRKSWGNNSLWSYFTSKS